MSIVAAACNSEPDVEPIEPADNAADSQPDTEPDDAPDDEEEVPEVFQGQLYPPLPDLEPDPNAGDLEPQEAVLDIHRDLYDLESSALATNELDEEELRTVATDSFVAEIADEVERQREQGAVSINPDGEIPWVDVIVADEGEVVLGKCVVLGPEAGGYSVSSGEPTFDLESGASLEFVHTYTYSADEDSPRAWRASAFSSTEQEGCSAR